MRQSDVRAYRKECRREVEQTRRAAESARADAERTYMEGREEVRFELERWGRVGPRCKFSSFVDIPRV
jgi:hypothetical protein